MLLGIERKYSPHQYSANLCMTLLNCSLFCFVLYWYTFVHYSRSSQSIKIGIDLSIDKSMKIGKSDFIDIDCIDQSVEIDDTLISSIDLSWFLPISVIHIGRKVCPSVHQKIKTLFTQTVNLLTMSGNWEAKDQTFITIYRLSNIITYKEIFTKNIIFDLFFKTRFKIFFWWLILARSVGAHFFRI